MSSLIQVEPSSSPCIRHDAAVVDSFGRVHSDLRVSITDRCNIRCFYCMPEVGATFAPLQKQLTFAQLVRLAKIAGRLGFHKIRLTGGEPLLRPKLPDLVAELSNLSDLHDLALTTNGVLLETHAQALYDAGLRRLNIHLDTLDRERFRQITRRDDLPRVLAGIDRALELGFTSIKLNAVAIKGLTEPDLVPLVRFARERGIELRFIEFMPLDSQEIWSSGQVLTADDMLSTLAEEFGPLTPVAEGDSRAPATQYRFWNGDRIGVIASVTRPFCGNCNRLRLTSDGKLRNCLFARRETDIRPMFDRDDEEVALEHAIRSTVWQKGPGHEIGRATFVAPERPMYSIGG